MPAISSADIDALCRPGDIITVEYLHPDSVALAIRLGELGKASHVLCCLGGLDIVEASSSGIIESNLHNYLRGNCILTVRRAKPAPTPEEAEKATDFWSDRVNDPYDWGMIFGSIPVLFCRLVLGFFSKKLGDWALKNLPNFLASDHLSTCAELGIRGIRKFRPTAFTGYPIANIEPELSRTHPSLHTKAVLVAPVLIG